MLKLSPTKPSLLIIILLVLTLSYCQEDQGQPSSAPATTPAQEQPHEQLSQHTPEKNKEGTHANSNNTATAHRGKRTASSSTTEKKPATTAPDEQPVAANGAYWKVEQKTKNKPEKPDFYWIHIPTELWKKTIKTAAKQDPAKLLFQVVLRVGQQRYTYSNLYAETIDRAKSYSIEADGTRDEIQFGLAWNSLSPETNAPLNLSPSNWNEVQGAFSKLLHQKVANFAHTAVDKANFSAQFDKLANKHKDAINKIKQAVPFLLVFSNTYTAQLARKFQWEVRLEQLNPDGDVIATIPIFSPTAQQLFAYDE